MVRVIPRYQMSGIVQQGSDSVVVSYGTLAVNLIGFLSQLAEAWGPSRRKPGLWSPSVSWGGLHLFYLWKRNPEPASGWEGTLALWNIGAHISEGLVTMSWRIY